MPRPITCFLKFYYHFYLLVTYEEKCMKLYNYLIISALLLLTYNVFAMQKQESEKIEKLKLRQYHELLFGEHTQIMYISSKKAIAFIAFNKDVQLSSRLYFINQMLSNMQTIGFASCNSQLIWAAFAKNNHKNLVLIGLTKKNELSHKFSVISPDSLGKILKIKPFIKDKKELWCTFLSYNKNTNTVSKQDHNCELQLDS